MCVKPVSQFGPSVSDIGEGSKIVRWSVPPLVAGFAAVMVASTEKESGNARDAGEE